MTGLIGTTEKDKQKGGKYGIIKEKEQRGKKRMSEQITFSQIEFGKKRKRTHKEIFLEKKSEILPLEAWCSLIRPYYYENGNGRQPIALEVMLKMYLVSNWYNTSDEATEDMLNENLAVRGYVGIIGDAPDATTLCRFRTMLERHKLTQKIFDQLTQTLVANKVMLREGTIVDATFIEAPNSSRTRTSSRIPRCATERGGKSTITE